MLGRLPGQQAWLMDHFAVAAVQLLTWKTNQNSHKFLWLAVSQEALSVNAYLVPVPSLATRCQGQLLVSDQHFCSLSVGPIALHGRLPA